VSERGHRLGRQLAQGVDHLVVALGKAAEVLLAEHELTAGADLEDAARALDELRLDAESLLDRGGQTDRPRLVVSLHAVLDRYLHSRLLGL
jgi:hypothetical protein